MATWLRSTEQAVCPVSGERIKAEGSKWNCYSWPCQRAVEKCPHLARSYAGCYNATVQCRHKGV